MLHRHFLLGVLEPTVSQWGREKALSRFVVGIPGSQLTKASVSLQSKGLLFILVSAIFPILP